jgi:hypothetical protein
MVGRLLFGGGQIPQDTVDRGHTRDIIVVALSFGKKTIPDLPCKD